MIISLRKNFFSVIFSLSLSLVFIICYQILFVARRADAPILV